MHKHEIDNILLFEVAALDKRHINIKIVHSNTNHTQAHVQYIATIDESVHIKVRVNVWVCHTTPCSHALRARILALSVCSKVVGITRINMDNVDFKHLLVWHGLVTALFIAFMSPSSIHALSVSLYLLSVKAHFGLAQLFAFRPLSLYLRSYDCSCAFLLSPLFQFASPCCTLFCSSNNNKTRETFHWQRYSSATHKMYHAVTLLFRSKNFVLLSYQTE